MLSSLLIISAWFVTPLLFLAHPSYSLTEQEDDKTYDEEFFSITYPSSWHVSNEPWFPSQPGESGVILQNDRKDTNQANRITPRSSMDYSLITVTVMPRESFFGSSDLSALELVDSIVEYAFSQERLAYYGAQLIADNYTSISGTKARSISFTTDGYYNLVINSADEKNVYQLSYTGQESKVQEELTEVQSIISSFKIKEMSDGLILSPV
ncbi:MAG TPA: PsbP-related protein [Nitrososphaeraceae archaeon]